MRMLLPLLLILLLPLTACGDDDPLGPKNALLQINGTVTDSLTGAPIAGATLEFGESGFFTPTKFRVTTTDSQGRYTLSYRHERCLPSSLYLAVYAEGYIHATVGTFYDRKMQCTEDVQTFDFALPPRS